MFIVLYTLFWCPDGANRESEFSEGRTILFSMQLFGCVSLWICSFFLHKWKGFKLEILCLYFGVWCFSVAIHRIRIINGNFVIWMEGIHWNYSCRITVVCKLRTCCCLDACISPQKVIHTAVAWIVLHSKKQHAKNFWQKAIINNIAVSSVFGFANPYAKHCLHSKFGETDETQQRLVK